MQIRGHVRTIKTGSPVPDGTEVEIRRHIDSSLIATVVTAGGMYEYFMNGSPGPYYVRVAIDEEVHISSSQVVGMSGPLDVGGLPLYFRLWNDGYISGVLEESSVFASGSGMQVTVRSGVHLVRGVLYDQQGHVNLAVDAADSQPRIDTVVIETMQPGSGRDIEGRTRLVVKKGTPAATPTAPSLTQTTSGIWEHPIANVRIDPAVSSVASNKVTDRRVPSNVKITDGYISTAMLADGAVTSAKLANSAVGTGNIQNKAVTRSKIADKDITHLQILNGTINEDVIGPQAVTTEKIASGAVTSSKIATNAVTGSELAPNAVNSGHIVNGSIIEADLSASVQTKLNAHGYNHDTEAPIDWRNVNSTTASGYFVKSLSLAPGSWALTFIFNGQVISQNDAVSGMQLAFTGTAAGGLVASHAIQNVEGPVSGSASNNVSFVRINRVTNSSSTPTTYQLNLTVRRISGGNGRIAGNLQLAAIKVG